MVNAALFSVLKPEEPELSGNTGYQEEQPGYYPGGRACYPSKINRLSRLERLKRAEECREAREQHRLNANDLIQQRRSADAAEATAILAYQQARTALFGLIFTFGALCAAIFAAIYAGRAASIARNALQSEFRPWIKVGHLTIQKEERRYPKVTVDIVNTGRSPAIINGSHVQIWIGTTLPMRRPYQGLPETKWTPPFIKGEEVRPGESKSASVDCVIDGQDAAGVQSGRLKLYVMGWVQYLDHRIPRRTMFCRIYDPSTGRLVPTNDPDYEVQH